MSFGLIADDRFVRHGWDAMINQCRRGRGRERDTTFGGGAAAMAWIAAMLTPQAIFGHTCLLALISAILLSESTPLNDIMVPTFLPRIVLGPIFYALMCCQCEPWQTALALCLVYVHCIPRPPARLPPSTGAIPIARALAAVFSSARLEKPSWCTTRA